MALPSFDELPSLNAPVQPMGTTEPQVPMAPAPDAEEGVLGTANRIGTAFLRGGAKGIGEIAQVASFGKIDDNFLNVFGESQTGGEELAEGIGNFAVGFLPAVGVLGKVATATKALKGVAMAEAVGSVLSNKFLKGTIAGAITDFGFFDEHTKRLSNIAEEAGIPFADILAQSDSDSEFVARLKSASEGVILGGATELFMGSAKALFTANKMKLAGKSATEVVEALKKDPSIQGSINILRTSEEEALAQTKAVPTLATEMQPNMKKGTRPDRELGANAVPVPVTSAPISEAQLGKLFNVYLSGNGDLVGEDIAREAPEIITSIKNLKTGKEAEEWFGSFVSAFDGFLKNRKGGVLPDAVRAEKGLNYLKETLDARGFETILGGARSSAQFASQLPVLTEAYKVANTLFHTASKNAVDEFLAEMPKFKGFAGTAKALAGELPPSARSFLQILEAQKAMSGYIKQIGAGASRTLRVFRKDNTAQAVEEILGSGREFIGKDAQALMGAVNSKGGLKRLEDLAMKIKLAGDNEVAFTKLVDGTRTGLDRLATYTINAMLSKVSTFATIQFASNSLTSLYLPLERATGALFRGDLAESKNALRVIGYYNRLAGEARNWFVKSLKEGQSFIGSESSVAEAGKQQVLGGVKYLETNAPMLAKALNGIDVLLTSPTRFMQAVDEGFKQLHVRASASAYLHGEALEKGLKDPAQIVAYVDEGLAKLVTQEGALNSELAIRQQAQRIGKARGLNKFDIADLENNMVAEYQPKLSRIESLAKDFSQEATFTRQGVLSADGKTYEKGFSQLVSNIASSSPLVRLVALPFVNTPMNLMKMVGQRLFPSITTNIPGIKGFHKQLINDMASGDPARMASAEGRIIMGNLMSVGALMTAGSGAITGSGPRDPEELKLLTQTGWQANSFRIPTPNGDSYISYAKLDPFASFLGITADFVDKMSQLSENHRQDGLQMFATAIGIAFAKNITNKTYLASLKQFDEAISQPDRFMEKFVQTKVGALVPSAVGGLAPLFNNEELAEVRSIGDAILAKIPGANAVESKRNILGEKITRNSPSVVDYLVPTAISKDKNDQVINELSRLQHGFRNPSTRLNGLELLDYSMPNGQTAYDRYMELTGQVKLAGKSLRQSLEKLIKSNQYQKLPDDRLYSVDDSPRISEIKKVINKYRQQARLQLQRELPKVKQQLRVVEQIKEGRRSGRSVEGLIQSLQGV